MRLLILTCILLLTQVPKEPEKPIQHDDSGTTAQEVQKQIEPLPALSNPVGGTVAAPVSKPEQTNTTNTYGDFHHLDTYTNLFFTGLITLFTGLTWLVYKEMLRVSKINERAWIISDIGSIEETKIRGTFQVTVQLGNGGKSPAWITRRVSTTLRHMRREFIEFYSLCWAVC
jgi:hypothetical protein